MNGRRSNWSHGRKSHTERGLRRTRPRPPLRHGQEPETRDRIRATLRRTDRRRP